MKCSKAGQFYGKTNETVFLNGIILNDADYLHERVDWHFHENAYFTFILEGSVLEGNKREVYECAAGSLLFHNWQDAHYNIKSNKFTRGFHVEIEPSWFDSFEIGAAIMAELAKLANIHPVTDISAKCDFADQSHFIRAFKSYHQLTPSRYRKLLLKKEQG